MSRFLACVLSVIPCLLSFPLASAQVPFLRGDVNDDGRRSIADAHYLSLWLSKAGPPPACLQAADANDDGKVFAPDGGLNDDNDVLSIFYDANCNGHQDGDCDYQYTPIAEPMSVPGDDPTPDDLGCESYTGAALPVSDPAARMEILDATAPGGESSLAVLKIRISHSRAMGGYSGVIDGSGLFAEPRSGPLDVDGFGWSPRKHTVVRDGVVSFSVLGGIEFDLGWPNTLVRYIWPPAEDLVVLKVYLRLEPGTPAGTYPIFLLEAEMADSLTGRAILPAIADGALTIERDVAFDATADLNTAGHWQCEARESLPPSGPEDVQVAFRMAMVPAEKGALVTVPLWIEANVPVEGFSFELTHATLEGKVSLKRILPVLRDGKPWEVFELQTDPASSRVRVETIFSRTDTTAFLPPGAQHRVLDFEFEVDATAPDGEAEITFWQAAVLAYGRFLEPSMVTCFERAERPGGLIIGENTTEFLRADANTDGAVSLADAVIIGYSTTRPNRQPLPCDDAADVNDNGTAEFTDAIRIFRHLFEPLSPETAIPTPFPEIGLDETLDPLPCEEYRVIPSPRTGDSIRLGSVEAASGEPVEVPVYVTTSLPLQSYQLVVGYDPQVWVPALDRVNLEGGVFESLARQSGINHIANDLVPGHMMVGFASDLVSLRPAPAGPHVLVGKIAGFVLDHVPVGTEIVLEPLLVPEGEAPRPDRFRTEIVEVEDAKLVTRIPSLEPAVLRVVDGSEATFYRGDSNSDLRVDIADPISVLNFLFSGGAAPSCEDAADADDSGRIEITDAVLILNYLFGTGPGQLAHPHPARGRDAMLDDLALCLEPPA